MPRVGESPARTQCPAGVVTAPAGRRVRKMAETLSDVERGRRRVTPRITGLYRRLEGEG